MLTEEQIEVIIERLINRIEKGNNYIINKISKNIKKIRDAKEEKIDLLMNELKYGEDFNDILNKINEITKINIKDVEKIFMEVARKNQKFASKFYDYKGIKITPIDENETLVKKIKEYSSEFSKRYLDIFNNIGYKSRNRFGNIIFLTLAMEYQNIINFARESRIYTKELFNNEMAKYLKPLSEGLKIYDRDNKRILSVNNLIKNEMQTNLRDMSNELQKTFGEEFESDGIEVSIHNYPAPDHAEVQGRQFTNEEFEHFQNNEDSVDVTGKIFTAEYEGRDRRSIGEYNCYHYVFKIIIGVDKPQKDENLNEIINQNNIGFYLDGKHYTLYEGTQLQRRLENRIREEENKQIIAKESDNEQLLIESQRNIKNLTKKYNELCEESGLFKKTDRLKNVGYKKR